MAIDANDRVWVDSTSGQTISLFDKNGKPLSPPEGYEATSRPPFGPRAQTARGAEDSSAQIESFRGGSTLLDDPEDLLPLGTLVDLKSVSGCGKD